MKRPLLIAFALVFVATSMAQPSVSDGVVRLDKKRTERQEKEPAKPQPRHAHRPVVKHRQSTGDTVTFTTVGTKPDLYAQTLDGYTLWRVENGDLVYAVRDKAGQMSPSRVLATDRRRGDELRFVASLERDIRFLPDPVMTSALLSGPQYPHTATPQDSLLVVLVEFPDVPFEHDRSVMENFFSQVGYDGTGSFKDYYRDQSGGRFDPGVRVVGPVMMPQNKSYYNQTSWLGSQSAAMVRSAIAMADANVDYSHFDIDNNGTVDAVLIFYAGERPESNSDGLWPHQSTVSGAGNHDGKVFSSYCIFDEGIAPLPTIGTACHEFGHVLGLPDLYDVSYSGNRDPGALNLMAAGNYNGGGKLPPNLSVMEKYLLGWAEVDTLQPADSIAVTALGTANDRGYYLSSGGGEFFMFEARNPQNHWDAGLGMEYGGLVVYHGKDNWGSGNNVNATSGNEGWYPVPAAGEYIDNDDVPFSDLCGIATFTPNSFVKPMQNNGTPLDDIWITDIRWTSDTTMAFAYATTAPARNLVDAIPQDVITDVTSDGFTARGTIVCTTGPLTAKGIVYAATPEACNLAQGTVVNDPSLANNSDIEVTVSGLDEGTLYYRVFVTAGGSTAYSAAHKVSVYRMVTLRHVYKESGGYRYFFDMELSPNCMGYRFQQMIYYEDINDNIAGFRAYDATDVGGWRDVSGLHYEPFQDYEPWRVNGQCVCGVWAVSHSGDTVPVLITFDPGIVEEIVVPTIGTYTLSTSTHGTVVDGAMAEVFLSLPASVQMQQYATGALSKSAFKSLMRTYAGNELDFEYGYDENWNPIADTVSWRVDMLQAYQGFLGGNSLDQRLVAEHGYQTYEQGQKIVLPVVDAASDSMVFLVARDEHGISRVFDLGPTCSENKTISSYSWPSGFVSVKYSGDSTLRFTPHEMHHFYLLHGKEFAYYSASEALSYCQSHPSTVKSYAVPAVFIDYDGVVYKSPDRVIVGLGNWESQIWDDAPFDGDWYPMFILPYDYAGTLGSSTNKNYEIKYQLADIEPDGSISGGATQWYDFVGDSLVWRWTYSELDDEQSHVAGWHRAVLKAGVVDSIAAANGTTVAGALGAVKSSGAAVRSIAPNESDTVALPEQDSIGGLELNSDYEICLWRMGWNYGLGRMDTVLQRKTFSTDVPAEALYPTVVSMKKERQNLGSNTYVPKVTVAVSPKTAYWHLVYGERSELAANGIHDMATAKAYSLAHAGEMDVFTDANYVLYFFGNNDASGHPDWNISTRVISSSTDSIYLAYAIPYGSDGQQGAALHIAFNGATSLPTSVTNANTSPATDITTESAVLHAAFPPRSNAPYYVSVGFLMQKVGATKWDTLRVDYNEEDSLTMLVEGLEMNTAYRFRYFYRYGLYNSSTDKYTYYNGSQAVSNARTFTTANCTVSAAIDTTVCYDGLYEGQHYSVDQTFERLLTSVSGCDSLLTVNLHVLPSRESYDTELLCYGSEFMGTHYFSDAAVTHVVQEPGMCDSTVHYTLFILPQRIGYREDTLCYGDMFEGSERYGDTTLTYTITQDGACDSTDVLLLAVRPRKNEVVEMTACDGYEWHGVTYTASTDEPADTTADVFGCDSITTLHLTVNYSSTTTDTVTACDSYAWHGDVFTMTDTTAVFDTVNVVGCDSLTTLLLSINYSNGSVDSVTACNSFIWFGTEYTESTDSVNVVFQNVDGCDSVVALNLTIIQCAATTLTVCESYTWHDFAYRESGTYVDGTDTLHLVINNPVHTVSVDTACGSYVWNDFSYAATGDYTFSHADANGCMQVDTLHLVINNPVHTVTADTACGSYVWNDSAYAATGDYTFSHADANGCVQVDTLHLVINNPVHTVTADTACGSYIWNDSAYAATGDYTFSHADANGCVQVDTLHLVVNYSTSSYFVQTVCDRLVWHGATYTASGLLTDTMVNAAGCDSVVLLDLTVNYSSASIAVEVACDSFVWHGATYTASGVLTDTMVNAVGCDSVVSLDLTVNYSSASTAVEVACDSLVWHGATYTASGLLTDTMVNAAGCDSVVSLDLTVNYSSASTAVEVACDSLVWHGAMYTASGLLTDTMVNAAGCDSVVSLDLTVNQGSYNTVEQTACDSLEWRGNFYSASGSYTFIYINGDGCESVDTLVLSMHFSTNLIFDTTAENSYVWNGTTYAESGTYDWTGITVDGCDSVVTMNLTITSDTTTEDIVEVDAASAKVYASDGLLVVEGADGGAVVVYDAAGRIVAARRNNHGTLRFDVPSSGAYLVRIGKLPVVRVVITR